MRSLLASALSLGLFLGCVPESTPSSNPSAAPLVTATPPAAVGAPCAPAIPTRGSGTATLALLPHAVGSLVLFGLDGSFVASANSYPLGAQHWWELDNDGAIVRRFDWRLQLGMLQSPDGRKVVYGGLDPASGKTELFVRDMNGPERFVVSSERPAFAWLDADRVLVDPVDEQGIVHAIDTRTGANQIVFAPPPPPIIKADSDVDYFKLSGDLRWAIFVRANADGARVRQDLFDVARQSYVPSVTLGLKDIWLAPAGDLALWLDGTELRAMHLCDRQVVTIGTVASSPGGVQSIAWSGDHRFASFSFGLTDDLTGPERIVVIDLQRGAIADLERPWGFIRQWSPDGRYVVLSRRGFHEWVSKLAEFVFK